MRAPYLSLIALLLAGSACRRGGVADTATRADSGTDRTPRTIPDSQEQACGGGCGKQRWAIKTLSDRQRDRVRLDTIIPVTIEQLAALRPPPRLSPYWRVLPVETTVYRVDAYLVRWSQEKDRDYHLVLASVRNPSLTMIAEIPAPECQGACRSGFAAEFGRMRQEIVQRFEAGAVAPERGPGPRVTVVGVGFFDREHHQRGAASNQIELHPVLSVRFH